MFRDELQRMLEAIDGSVAAVIMGFDGIALQTLANPRTTGASAMQHTDHSGTASDAQASPAASSATNIETLGMELSALLANLRAALHTLGGGAAREMCLRAGEFHTIVRFLDEQYFLAVTVSPGSITGKARFSMRIHGARILEQILG